MDIALVLDGAVRLATPVGLAALGETVAERSGTINLGIEGTMLGGALAGAYGASQGGWAAGVGLALLVGGMLGLLTAIGVFWGRANQFVVGLALTLAATGAATYLYELWLPSGADPPEIPLAPAIRVPLLADLPVVGRAVFDQSLFSYALVALVLGTWWTLRRTGAGLAVRAVGDDPERAALRGVPVRLVRTAALVFAGALAAAGGAALTVGYLGAFDESVTAGRGYVALAAVLIGRWSPWGGLAGAGVFAFFDSLAIRGQAEGIDAIPVELLTALPYVMTLVALVVVARGSRAPRALGREYEPG